METEENYLDVKVAYSDYYYYRVYKDFMELKKSIQQVNENEKNKIDFECKFKITNKINKNK